MTTPGTLYLVGTPIGNLGDVSARALETLRAVDLIAAEDTRETRKLLAHHGIDRPLVAHHEHNERPSAAGLVDRLLGGEAVALVSDAGMPGISDPGEALVAAAIAAGITVVPIPGPTAFVAALVASGLPTRRFAFEGFLGRDPKMRRRRLRELVRETRTMAFYEAPHRLAETLADMAAVFGEDRPAAVARELTKKFEEVVRGPLATLRDRWAAEDPRGEIVIVVGGAAESEDAPEAGWEDALRGLLAGGMRASEAAKAIQASHGVPRSEAYDAAQRLKPPAPPKPPKA